MSAKPANDVVCDGDGCDYVPDSKAGTDAAGPEQAATCALANLLGDTLVGKGDSKVSLASITGKNKVIALYFSGESFLVISHP